MSIDLPIPEPIVITSVKDRSWRVECYTDYGTDYRFVAHRERVYLDAEGSIVKRESMPDVSRSLSQVQANPTALAMLGAIKLMADTWAEEDGAAHD